MADAASSPSGLVIAAFGLSAVALAGLIAHVLTGRSHPKQFGEVHARIDALQERMPSPYEFFLVANALARSDRPGGPLLSESEYQQLIPAMNRGYRY